MPKIHCLNNISTVGTDKLPASYELVDDIDAAEGIMVRSAAMHDMQFSENLLAIARAGAGVNNIPLDRCAEEGIVVFNTPGANANAVKELVLCGMLLASRDIIGGVKWVTDNASDENIAKSAEKAKKQFAGREIMGKKLGVIGLGAIGALVANAALDLGMEVYGYDPYVSVNAAWRIDARVKHVTDVNEIYANSDYITIHVPAMDATKGMVDQAACAAMKEGAVFLNFSRDTLVDTDAMAEALASGRVARYVTDFATPAVVSMENVLVIPHLGASTAEAEDNCAIMAAAEISNYIDNGNIINSVNFPACDMGPCRENAGRIAILHKNVPNMVGQITNVLGSENANIDKMTNGARGDFAYTMIDLDAATPAAAAEKISGIEGVVRVRVIK